jgi:hypothetical protein
MVKKSPKKFVKIPPTRIDKDFFGKLINVLKTECPDFLIHISVFSDSMNLESEDEKKDDYKEFDKEDIPTDTYRISITSYPEKPYTEIKPSDTFPVEIEIDFLQPNNSRIRVYRERTGLVEGTTKTLLDVPNKKKLGLDISPNILP